MKNSVYITTIHNARFYENIHSAMEKSFAAEKLSYAKSKLYIDSSSEPFPWHRYVLCNRKCNGNGSAARTRDSTSMGNKSHDRFKDSRRVIPLCSLPLGESTATLPLWTLSRLVQQ